VLIAGLLLGYVLFTVMHSDSDDSISVVSDQEERDLTHEEMLRLMAENQDEEPETDAQLSNEEMLQIMNQLDESTEEVDQGFLDQSNQTTEPELTAAEMLQIMNQLADSDEGDRAVELEAAVESTANDSGME
jgi:hypothetical protein